MKKLLILIMALMIGDLYAQSPEVGHLAIAWDVDSDVLTYPVLRGRRGDPYSGTIEGQGTLTAATSVTVDGTAGAFTDIAVDDVIVVTKPTGLSDVVVVVTRASDIQITVDTAVTWAAGTHWRYYKFSAGTADTDGWIDVSGFSGGANITVQYDQGDLVTGLEVRWEAKSAGVDAKPITIYPGDSSDCGGGTLISGVCLFATAGQASRNALIITGEENWSAVRVGVRRSGADTSDAAAARERVSISVAGRGTR
jgi:hypothetical protein